MTEYPAQVYCLSGVFCPRIGQSKRARARKGKKMEECVYCEGVADFVQIDGGWYVCAGCIKDGETDTVAEVAN